MGKIYYSKTDAQIYASLLPQGNFIRYFNWTNQMYHEKLSLLRYTQI